jgi:uncharacterized protein Yka (UPF0111/DUF47 family)
MFSLFPREEDFFLLFRKQAMLVREACTSLHEMMEKFDRLEERARELKDIELRADEVTHEIFERLNRTFITPLDREDIHDLASGLDNVVDAAEAIGSRVVLFRVGAPTPEAVRMTAILMACSVQIEQAAGNLKPMKNLLGFTIEIKRPAADMATLKAGAPHAGADPLDNKVAFQLRDRPDDHHDGPA